MNYSYMHNMDKSQKHNVGKRSQTQIMVAFGQDRRVVVGSWHQVGFGVLVMFYFLTCAVVTCVYSLYDN